MLEGIRRPVLALSAAVLALHVLLGAGAQATEAMPVRIPDSGLHELDSDVVCDDASSVRFPIRREGTVGPHMTQSFANRLAEYRYHDGEDWKTDESDDVYPVATGRIEYVGEISSTGKADGDVIVVHHTGRFVVRVSDAQGNPSGVKVVTEFWSAYLHVVPGSVAKGDCVTPGAPLGTTSPTSTNAYGEHPAHLHLSIRLVDCKTMGSDCSGAYRPSAKAVLDSGAIHPSDFIDANQGFAPVGTIPAGSSKPPGLPSRLPWADGERHALAPSSYVAEDPGGWGPQVVSTVQFPIDRGDLVYPMYGGTVVWAGCASGDAEYLGNTVVVRTTDPVGGSDYLAVYGHLGRIDVGLGDVSVNTPLGTFGATTRVNRDACEDVLGAPRLQFGLFKGGAMTTGGVSSGVPIAPEPLIGDGVYEKFTWWTGPARARDLRAFVGNPGGSWCDDAVECPAIGGASLWLDQIRFNEPVHYRARLTDSAPIKQVNFTAYYPDWATGTGLPGFDPVRTWRIVASCRPPDETGDPSTTPGCEWHWAQRGPTAWVAEVAFDWYPESTDTWRPPWQPMASRARDLGSQCTVARLSFDVYDHAGYRRLAPNGTTPPTSCLTPTVAAVVSSPTSQLGTSVQAADGDGASAVYLLPFLSAVDCDTSWKGGSGTWWDADRWTSGLPDAGHSACINGASDVVTLDQSAQAASLVNAGTIRTDPKSSSITLDTSGGPLFNTGTITRDGFYSTIIRAGSITNTGTIDATPTTGYPYRIGLVAPVIDNQGTIDLARGGDFSGGSSTTALQFANSGTLHVPATREARVFLAGGTFTQTGGTLAIDGDLVVDGTLRVDGGAITGNPVQIDGGGALSVAPDAPAPATSILFTELPARIDTDLPAGFTVVASAPTGTLTLGDGDGFTNAGTIRTDPKSSSITLDTSGGPLFNTGTITRDGFYSTIIRAGSITNTGTIDATPTTGYPYRIGLVAPVIDNQGTIDLARGGDFSGGASGTPLQLTNSGTLHVTATREARVFLAGGTFTQTAGTLAIDGDLLVDASTLRVEGGAITGTGTLDGDLYNAGTVAPGDSPGILTVTGDYVQAPAGTLSVEIASLDPGDIDLLRVGGAAQIAGILKVQASGYVPVLDDLVTLIEAGAVSGSFATIDGAAMGTGLGFVPDPTATAYRLRVVAGVTDQTPPVVTAPKATIAVGSTLGTSTVPVALAWTGSDAGGSGIDHYELALSTNGGAYTVVASPTGTAITRNLKPSKTTTYRFQVRAIDAAGNPSAPQTGPAFRVLRTQQSSSAVRYRGTWTTSRSSQASGGSYRVAKAKGASASYAFTGRTIAWVATKGTGYGKAKVYLDGRYVTTVDLRASATQWRRIVFTKTWSTAGKHTLRIVNLATSGHPRASLDALVVLR